MENVPKSKAGEPFKYRFTTIYGVPLKVTRSDLLFYLTLREGVKYDKIEYPFALAAEWNFSTQGWPDKSQYV